MTILQVSSNDTFQLWLSKTNQVISVSNQLTDGTLTVNGALIFSNATFSLTLASANVANNLVLTSASGNSLFLLASNIACNGTVFSTGSGTGLSIANNAWIGGTANIKTVNTTTVNASTLHDAGNRVLTSIVINTTGAMSGGGTINGPTGTVTLDLDLVDTIVSTATNQAATANSVSAIAKDAITKSGGGIIRSTVGNWSNGNFSEGLVLTTGTSGVDPALGIADSANANLWCIVNEAGNLSIASMPDLGNSVNGPNRVVTFSNTGLSVAGSLSVGGAFTIEGGDPFSQNHGRNIFHNARFRVNQRGLSSYSTTLPDYTLDRWQVLCGSGGSRTITPIALTDSDRSQIGNQSAITGLQYSFTGGIAPGDYEALQQPVEDVRTLAGKTVTVSFWAKCLSGLPKVSVGWSQYFGVGGSASVLLPAATTVFLTTVWKRYSVTFTIPSVIGKAIQPGNSSIIEFFLSTGSTYNTLSGGVGIQNNIFTFWGMQLENNSYATLLEEQGVDLDYLDCRRYFQGPHQFIMQHYLHTASPPSSVHIGGTYTFPPMRIVPGASVLSDFSSGVNQINLNQITTSAIWFDGTFLSNQNPIINILFNLTADL